MGPGVGIDAAPASRLFGVQRPRTGQVAQARSGPARREAAVSSSSMRIAADPARTVDQQSIATAAVASAQTGPR